MIHDLLIAVQASIELPERETVVAVLVRALEDPSPAIQIEAAQVLGAMGVSAQLAVPPLTEMLAAPATGVRAAAASALGALQARESLAALVKGCADAQVEVRRACTRALGELHDERVIPSLGERLEDPEHGIRIEAAFALSSLGEAAVPCLLTILRTGSKDAVIAALNGFEDMPAVDRKDVLEAIAMAKEHEDWEIRRAATAVLQSWRERLEPRQAGDLAT